MKMREIDHGGFRTVSADNINIAEFNRTTAHWAGNVIFNICQAESEFGDNRLESAAEIIVECEGLGTWELIDWANMASRVAFPLADMANAKSMDSPWISYMESSDQFAEVVLDLIENSLDAVQGPQIYRQQINSMIQTRMLWDIEIAEIYNAAHAAIIGEVCNV
jgi:hypothetical protein